jgi:ABC-type dipeptide/oligopeptide/nickel transport system permease component
LTFILKRILAALITMFLVSVLCFLVFGVIRGDPASLVAGITASEQQLETLREEMGLNRNIVMRYGNWLTGFLGGNLGNSLRFRGESVSAMITQRLPVSLFLAFLALGFILIISIPLSLFTVKREGSFPDRLVNMVTAMGIGIPGFFLGLVLIWIFGIGFKLFTPGWFVPYRDDPRAFFTYLCFPALAIAIPNSAIMIQFLRGALFNELQNDYVRTARSKGAGRSYILRRHVLKNAVPGAITVFGMICAEVLGGSIIMEQVFTIPGIGRLFLTAIASRDYPLIQAIAMYIAFIIVIANTLADIAVMVINPGIVREKKL